MDGARGGRGTCFERGGRRWTADVNAALPRYAVMFPHSPLHSHCHGTCELTMHFQMFTFFPLSLFVQIFHVARSLSVI